LRGDLERVVVVVGGGGVGGEIDRELFRLCVVVVEVRRRRKRVVEVSSRWYIFVYGCDEL